MNSEIRSAKHTYSLKNFNECFGDSRNTWQTINELTSRKSGKKSVTSLKVNGVSITMLFNEFNNHFATIGRKLAEKNNSSNTDSYLDYLTNTDERFHRPISVISVVAKVLDRIIYDRWYAYL